MGCLPSVRVLIGVALMSCSLMTTSAEAGWEYTDAHVWEQSDNSQEYSWSWEGGRACAKVLQDYAKQPYKARKDNTHRGIDIEGERGTPILAAAPGEVIATIKDYWGGGKAVIIHHGKTPEGNHLFTFYFHMNSITIDERDMVNRGQEIGTMGKTGKLAAIGGRPVVHLHFSTRVNSNGNFKYGEDMEYSDEVNFAHRNPHQFWYGADNGGKTAVVPVFNKGHDYGDVGGYSAELTYPLPCP